MDPDLIQQLLQALNPIGSAQAQMLGPNIAPPAPGAGMVPAQGLDLPQPTVGQGGSRAQEFVVPGPRLDLAAQAIPPQAPQSVAAATVPPPPAPGAPAAVPGVPTPTNPMARPPEPYMSEPAATVGSVLEPHPLPQPRPANAPTATDLSGQAKPGDDILKSLRGVQMPKPPEAQKVSTPHAPQLRPIQSGGLADLMASLNIGPQQAFPGLKLPSTLGQALGGR